MYKIISTLHGYKDSGLPIDSFKLNNIFNWYVPAIKHCQKLNPNCEIHILTDLVLNNKFDNRVYIHELYDSDDAKFLKENFINLSPNPHHMEYNSMVRFIYLKNFCVKNNIDEFLYLEPDVLVFSDILEDKEYLKSLNYNFTLMLERCAGVCFFNNGINILKDISQLMVNSYSTPQIEPRAFDMDFYKKNATNNYPHGGVTDMHFWNWYCYTHQEVVLKNMDKNDNGVFWHTCITRSMDDSEISLKRWKYELDETINRNIKYLELKNNRCYSFFENQEVQIKYLHFNENTKLIIPKYALK